MCTHPFESLGHGHWYLTRKRKQAHGNIIFIFDDLMAGQANIDMMREALTKQWLCAPDANPHQLKTHDDKVDMKPPRPLCRCKTVKR
jgi:hypothetical protein